MPIRDSQTPIEQNFDQNEIGLQPPFILNRILANYIKTLTYLFARDEDNKIWRMLRTDNHGNLKTSPGTQNKNIPLVFQFTAQLGMTLALPANSLRKCVVIYNIDMVGGAKEKDLNIQLGQTQGSPLFRLKAGWAYTDNLWSGDIFLQSQNTTHPVTIVEYY